MEPQPIYAAPIVYRERGAFLRRIEKLNKAKVSYDTAYSYKQDDVRMLTGRSQVCIDAVQPIQAYEDAELALKLEPQNMTACIMRARALYTMLEFERSLVMHYRGARRRRLPRYFSEGIGQGIETIQNSIGKNTGNVMINFLDLIKRNQSAYIDENQPEKLLHISRIPHLETKAKLTQLEARKQVILSRVMAMKYLGRMAWDKFFLQELSSATFQSKSLKSANAKGSQDLNELVNKTLQMLSERQEMLRVQRPYYAIVQAENSVSRYQTMFRKQLLNNERKAGTHTANLYLKQMLSCFIHNKIMDLNAKAERMQIFLDSKTPRTLPNKEYYTDKLYTLVGKAYLSQYRLSYELPDNGNRRRVAFLLGLPVSRPISYDSVIYNYPHKRVDLQETLSKMMNTLETCENSLRKCWLTCNIARILTAQKNYSLSKYYAKLCQDEATQIENVVWWLNGCFIMLSGDMQQGNASEVRAKVEEAYHWAKLLKNSEIVLAFLAKCAEMAAEPIIVDKRKTILQRETGILKMIDSSLRLETEVLFKRISMVPSRRRLSVLPCKSKLSEDKTARQKRRQRGLSIVPGNEQVLSRPQVSKVMGFQVFDI
ncbi:tetratricopeptide repeat protein 25-like [Hyposmocoma kahamanoa]|uniref:tetratricopeptide repeat protein 25-like n=1 Tax=Hyposmocoma kahamanoa TaxID=1477025 RepID=UPI000E6D714F|nr:tetratricopeptide repeat protein 25-like [Hyposmocoma kahamanoa]